MTRAKTLQTIEQNRQTPLMDGIKSLKLLPRFFKEIHQTSPFLFWVNLFARLLSAFIPVASIWVAKMIIDHVLLLIETKGEFGTTLWILVGLEFLFAILSDLLGRAISLTDGLLGDLYSNQSSVRLIQKTGEVELRQLEDPDFYDKLSMARSQTAGRVFLMSNILSQFQDLIVVSSLIGGLIYFEPLLIILLIASVIPAFINEAKFSSSSYSLARSWTSERRELDYLRYIGANDRTAKEVKLFGLVDFIADRFGELSHRYYQANRSLAIRKAAWGSVFNIIGVLSYYGAYIFILYRTIGGKLSIGELSFLSSAFNRLRSNLQNIFSRFTRITENALYLRDYYDFLDLETDTDVEKFPLKPLPTTIREGIRFENVSFNYPESDVEVLKGVSFFLPFGKKMALVGENGSGKTTLIKLLLRFYEPTEGRITLDGVDIRYFDKKAYQSWFGVIFQDFEKYEFTIGENIGVGNIAAYHDKDRIAQAAEMSLAAEFITKFPKQYDQQLGKRFKTGKELSGGQWQKIALARAYVKNAPVIILDEPTSALDAQAEHEAFQRFVTLTQGKSAVIISHRFSTVRMADFIIVLGQGKILEEGSHEQLMEKDGLYAHLFELQAEGYQ